MSILSARAAVSFPVVRIAASPVDGGYIALISGAGDVAFVAADGESIGCDISASAFRTVAASWHPRAAIIAIGDASGAVALVSVSRTERGMLPSIAPLTHNEPVDGAVSTLSWSPDGRALVATSDSGAIVMWRSSISILASSPLPTGAAVLPTMTRTALRSKRPWRPVHVAFIGWPEQYKRAPVVPKGTWIAGSGAIALPVLPPSGIACIVGGTLHDGSAAVVAYMNDAGVVIDIPLVRRLDTAESTPTASFVGCNLSALLFQLGRSSGVLVAVSSTGDVAQWVLQAGILLVPERIGRLSNIVSVNSGKQRSRQAASSSGSTSTALWVGERQLLVTLPGDLRLRFV